MSVSEELLPPRAPETRHGKRARTAKRQMQSQGIRLDVVDREIRIQSRQARYSFVWAMDEETQKSGFSIILLQDYLYSIQARGHQLKNCYRSSEVPS